VADGTAQAGCAGDGVYGAVERMVLSAIIQPAERWLLYNEANVGRSGALRARAGAGDEAARQHHRFRFRQRAEYLLEGAATRGRCVDGQDVRADERNPPRSRSRQRGPSSSVV